MTSIERFRALHAARSGKLLVLPNAWDVLSARLFEEAGAEAIATSSAVVAWAHGYGDGQQLPEASLVAAVRELGQRVRVPLSVDVERGYGSEPQAVVELIEQLVAAGAVGINLEDGAADAELLAANIRALRARFGSALFINARTCVVLFGKVSGEAGVREVLERARLYESAGADGLFVPLLSAPQEIAAVAGGTGLPLNVMWVPGLPPPAALAELGARRLSAGTRLGSLAYQTAADAARAWLERGDETQLVQGARVDYAKTNALMR